MLCCLLRELSERFSASSDPDWSMGHEMPVGNITSIRNAASSADVSHERNGERRKLDEADTDEAATSNDPAVLSRLW